MSPQGPKSTQLLIEEAKRRNVRVTMVDHETVVMEKKSSRWIMQGSKSSLQSSVGRNISADKALTKKIFSLYDIKSAKYYIVRTKEDLKELNKLKYPLVLKPTLGMQSKGVVTNIKNVKEAKEAFKTFLHSDSNFALFEETLEGNEYRVLCIDYKVFAAAERKPAHVIGNGINTIAELIEKKNAKPNRGEGYEKPLTKINITSEIEKYLHKQNLQLNSIPEKNQYIRLLSIASMSTGGEPYDITEEIHPDNINLFEKISKVACLNTVGIDVMCQTLSKPIEEQSKAGILEINAAPGLRMHYYPSKGKSRNAAKAILDMVFKELHIS